MFTVSIKNRILSLCLVSLVGFTSILSVGGDTLTSNTQQVNRIDQVTYPVMNAASLNSVLISQLAERFNLAVTLGDDEILEMNKQTLAEIQNNFNIQISLDPYLQSSSALLQEQTNQYFELAYRIAHGMIDEEISLSEAGRLAKQSTALLEGLTSAMNQFLSARQSEFEIAVQELEANNKKANQIMSVTGVVAMLAMCIFGWLVIKGIRKNLANISNKMRDIAEGDGDLTVRLRHEKNDELKPLVESFNSFVSHLQQNVTNTINNVTQLDTISGSLVTSSQVTSELSTKQHLSIEEVSSSLNQLFVAAKEIATNANDASMSASSASEQANLGEQQVKSTILAVQELTQDVGNASQVVRQLNDNTQSAGSILESISSIAEQTNLLALNAAIEAARAGEQGRGFAVVSDEVRTLASRTQTSTQEIQSVLLQLQDQAKTASTIIYNSVLKAETCVEKFIVAENSLQQITSDITEISQRNESIAAATEKQEQTSTRIETFVEEIRKMAEGTSNSVQQVDTVAQDIQKVTHNISILTGHFKVS